jgi:trimethylamine:corrinoid methyltransferase-like protein
VGPIVPYITRKVPPCEVLDEEDLETIEDNAETILEETGIDFRDDAEALAIWKDAGAAIDGQHVRFPRGLCRSLIQRANAIWKRMLAEYKAPDIDPGVDEALNEYIARRKAERPDTHYGSKTRI